ncbi:hypothetical protein A4X13_0g5316 [Tilletia indica]|uniref:Myb/SANT-like domain-containing protein n=1 Tax=Tilletia indica TaxID=43049 RepID=A0A177T943_9BASI|nr:hypothetical protein A4X13_0g5316 [Tilletia indica]
MPVPAAVSALPTASASSRARPAIRLRTSPRKAASSTNTVSSAVQTAEGSLSGHGGADRQDVGMGRAGAQKAGARKPAAVAQGTGRKQFRWPRPLEEQIFEWLCRRDKNGIPKNFNNFLARKMETANTILTTFKLAEKGSDLTAKKVSDKLVKMEQKYKEIVRVLNQSGGGVGDLDEEMWTGDGAKVGESIKAFVDRTCHWYWAFDEVLGTKSNIRAVQARRSLSAISSGKAQSLT